jgi:hypothetical protein
MSTALATISAGKHVHKTAKQLYLAPFGGKNVTRSPGREVSVLEVLRVVRNFDPYAAQATWIWLRMANPGHTVEVVNTQTGETDPIAQDFINKDLAPRVWKVGGGGADTLVNGWNLVLFSSGGAGVDVEVSRDLNHVIDFHPFGPEDILFRYVSQLNPITNEPIGDPVLRLFDSHIPINQQPVPLPEEQVSYVALDPEPNYDPYGNPPLLPAATALIVVTELINEIIRVIHIHGVGIRDVTIDEDKARLLAPIEAQQAGNEGLMESFLEGLKERVRKELEEFENSDSFVHYKNIIMGMTAPGSMGIPADGILQELIHRAWVAVKTPPSIMSQMEGAQTQATVQWQVYVKGIKACLGLVKRLLENAYNFSLRVEGYLATATVTFNSIRETDAMIEANTRTVELNNLRAEYEDGLITFEEYCLRAEGTEPPDKTQAPPTKREQFMLSQTQVASQGLLGAGTPSASGSDSSNNNPPGSDQGLTAIEGQSLDQAIQAILSNQSNIFRLVARLQAHLLESRAKEQGDSFKLGETGIKLLGIDVVEETRQALRDLDQTTILELLDATEHKNGK